METEHNVTNLCALFDVGVDATCTSNVVHKVPSVNDQRYVTNVYQGIFCVIQSVNSLRKLDETLEVMQHFPLHLEYLL